MENTLFYGDNLEVLRRGLIPAESVDLIYLDPPFNSNRIYNVIFKSNLSGSDSQAQLRAFDDTWDWNGLEYNRVITDPRVPSRVKESLQAMVKLAGENALSGYLVMMAERLAELYRVLKPTGSLYLHCDPTASHYLKLLLDAVFGTRGYRNEITWKRTSAHNDPNRYGSNVDIILFYTKGQTWTWNQMYAPHDPEYVNRFRHMDLDGRHWTDADLTAKGLSGGGYEYEYRGVTSLWRCPPETMQRLDAEGKLHFTKAGGIRLKRYLDETQGVPLQALWDDIDPINSQAKERLGYPTQKPEALLERIIKVSSNPGDVVLDPFCGCGTAVVAAEKLGRYWLGIDITSLAISVIEKRMRKAYPDARFKIVGLPETEEDALKLAEDNKYDFQDWVVLKLGGQPLRESEPGKSRKGADGGVDGVIYFEDHNRPQKVIISVKGGKNYSVPMIRELGEVVKKAQAAIGVLVVIGEPTPPMQDWADSAGFFESSYIMRGHTQNYPHLQILTIADLIAGKGVEMPPHDEGQTMQTAQRGQRELAAQTTMFSANGH